MSGSHAAVVVMCQNHGRTLDEALASVMQQTRPPAEIVILDLASDQVYTRQVLARLERDGHRIVRTRNLSEGAARNLAVRSTASPYLVVFAGDLALSPDYIERASAVLDHDRELAFVTPTDAAAGVSATLSAPQRVTLIDALAHDSVDPSAMFRRVAWAAVDGFDEDCHGYQALDFWTSLLERGPSGAMLPGPNSPRRLGPPRANSPRGVHASLMSEFFLRHAAVVTEQAIPLLLAKEQRLLHERERHEAGHQRSLALHEELNTLHREIEVVLGQLGALGRSRVDFGDLRRTSPISPVWGLDRGLPLDRHYIESFLARHRLDIRGQVLEVKDAGYTRMFGDDRVSRSVVLDIEADNAQATIVTDLTKRDGIAADAYDCFVLTQTLGVIYDVRAALANAYRLLKPGGVLLCTLPAAGRISYEGPALDGDYWRFTEASVRELFAEVFPIDAFEVSGFGNVLTNAAFLYGLAPYELTPDELESVDPFFPILYGVRAVKPLHGVSVITRSERSSTWGAILMYHRVARVESSASDFTVSPEHFLAHLRWLSDHGVRIVALEEMARSIHERDLSGPTVALTFDDGYADALPLARGILRDLGLPATFFIVGQTLDGGDEFWWDALSRVFERGRNLPGRLVLPVGNETLDVSTVSAPDRAVARSQLRATFFKLGRRDRDRLVASLLDWSEVGARPTTPRPMTPQEIVELSSMPYVDIGAHSENHLWLPDQPRHTQAAEIQGSKARLEALVGTAISAFSYPYGVHDNACIELVRRAGFRLAVTTERRPVIAGDDPLRLPRIEVHDCDRDEFAARVGALLAIPESAREVVSNAAPHRAQPLAERAAAGAHRMDGVERDNRREHER